MHADWIIDYLQGQLQRQGQSTLSQQVYKLLREAIARQQLVADTALPASRMLAQALQIGRNTVLAAYDQLLAEGYLYSRPGAGTFVSPAFSSLGQPTATARGHAGLSQRGQALSEQYRLPTGLTGAFAPGLPELRQFPHAVWQRLQHQHNRQAPSHWWHYQQEGGLPALRQAICTYLQLSRSVHCQPEQILVVQGAQQALELTARLLTDPADQAWMEDPGYAGAQAAMQAAGLHIIPVPVDSEGLNPAAAPPDSRPRLVYITPSHQYPSGVVMSLARRLELLQHAEADNSWIIEDDYDSEFRYDAQPIASLQGLADSARVIYIGTFSKVMFPAMRLAYLVIPPALVDAFRSAYARLYREGCYAQQAALADFIEQGHFARHIRRMRDLYRIRQQLLRSTLQQAVGEAIPLSSGQAGMHLVASLPPSINDQQLSQQAAREQLWLRPLSRHFLGAQQRNGLVLGYAGVEDNDIRRSALRLAQLVEPLL
ncbi:PLP-dependent aminotransferase family protein [Aquitalea sp. USM4]|uniref:MocR-like pyridoxine biosynthesis transcription factor PdxR n=1 Tax=Aquitalea sp. USM4 TaxID=1590041 RepID=UPI00103EA475|nr:PLP-dependent aminotransferase family protein [Aquitalea sp. USM4]QBJ77523.1 PLP-dependent aminotransferase family protein [Aquitalea sp. USM4]